MVPMQRENSKGKTRLWTRGKVGNKDFVASKSEKVIARGWYDKRKEDLYLGTEGKDLEEQTTRICTKKAFLLQQLFAREQTQVESYENRKDQNTDMLV